jgi:hypothetical protein
MKAEFLVWAGYLLIVGFLFFRPQSQSGKAPVPERWMREPADLK